MAVLTFPLSCWVGLAVGGTEVTVAGYVRQPVVLAYCGDGVTISNLASQQWQHAQQSWRTIDTVQLWDSVSGGALLGSVPVNPAMLIDMYWIARIPASGFTLVYDLAFQAASYTPRPYGEGPYGSNIYGAYAAGVVLQVDFASQHACEPGTWAPGPFSLAA